MKFKPFWKEEGGLVDSRAPCFDDVLMIPRYTDTPSRKDLPTPAPDLGIDLPVIAANMDTITGPKMIKAMDDFGGVGILHRNMKPSESAQILKEANLQGPKAAAVGLVKSEEERERIAGLLSIFNSDELWICVDIAHGHCKEMADTIKYIKDRGPKVTVIAGNVATGEGAKYLENAGADIIKVGIGGGSVCTTRLNTGCGVPTLTSIVWCSRACSVPIIADGGIRFPGDIAKSIGAGASAAMVGRILAGTDMVPGWNKPGEWIEYRGMASAAAKKAAGRKAHMVEGASQKVKARGEYSTEDTLFGLKDGVRSAMSYNGARTLEELYTNSRFLQPTTATIIENGPHFSERYNSEQS